MTIENKIHKLEDEISHCNKEKVKLITNKESLINYIDTEELSSLGNEERAELFKKHLEKVKMCIRDSTCTLLRICRGTG